MTIGDIVSRWEEKGLRNIHSFTLSDHYSVLFDDESEGFNYIFKEVGVDRDTLLNSTNPILIKSFEEIDDDMEEVNYFIERFVTDILWSRDLEMDEVKEEVEQLRVEIGNIYSNTYQKVKNLKTHIEEVL